MSEPESGFSRTIELVNRHGLHLRPASKFVAEANRFECDVFVSLDGGDEGNGKSILDLTARAAVMGAMMRIRTVGKDAEAALAVLGDLVRAGFGELRGQ